MFENTTEIPKGNTLNDVKIRKKIIKNFYATWNEKNPTKQVFNICLQEFINVRFLSINETSEIASRRYLSTFVLVRYFSEILELAEEKRCTLPKKDNDNQKRFSEIISLEYAKEEIGTIKLTVDVLKGSQLYIQYCITAIE